MIKKVFKITLIVLLIPILLCQCNTHSSSKEEAEKPNVIFIYADDLGYGDVTCYNTQY